MGFKKLSKFEIVWRALNGQKLIPEYKFHPTRRWRVDWWHESGVAIEVEGSIFRQGRHTRGLGFMADMEKYNCLSERGVLLFRVPAHQITSKWLSPIIATINRGGSMSYVSLMKEIQKEYDDMRHQSFVDWRERVLRVEEPIIKSKEQKDSEEKLHNEECIKAFNEMAHNNPEWHLKEMAKELEHEMFCLMNKIPYEPGWRGGLPGYWNYRKEYGEEWILSTRERLPNE